MGTSTLRPARRRAGPVRFVRPAHHRHEVGDPDAALQIMAQVGAGSQMVVISPPRLLLDHVTLRHQLTDYLLHGSFSDTHLLRNVSHPRRRVPGKGHENVAIVGEKGPVARCHSGA